MGCVHPELLAQKSGVGGALAPVDDGVPHLVEVVDTGYVFYHLLIMLTQRPAPWKEHDGPKPLGRALKFFGENIKSLLNTAAPLLANPLGDGFWLIRVHSNEVLSGRCKKFNRPKILRFPSNNSVK